MQGNSGDADLRTDSWTATEGEGGTNQESSMETYTFFTCKTESQWKFAVGLRELKPVLCYNIAGEMGWEVGESIKGEET